MPSTISRVTGPWLRSAFDRPRLIVIRAAFRYFAIVLGSGFVLGVFRVPLLVPHLGERWAELLEMPLMAAVIFLASGHVLRRYPGIRRAGRAWAVGLLALALMIAAELGSALLIQDRTLASFIRSRDPISGSVYVLLLIAFAMAPRKRLSSIDV